MEIPVPKTLTQMKKRLEEAMSEVREAEEIIPLLKEVIAKFELEPADLFEATTANARKIQSLTSETGRPPAGKPVLYEDAVGNTWAGKGRRPSWLKEAIARGKTLEEFRTRGTPLRNAK